VKVIIPLAGKGTRLRPHTHSTPKPMVKVGGKPVMSYILDDLRKLGVNEAVFITGYLKEAVEKYVRADYPEFTAHFVEQAVQNGTAGAVQLAEPFIDSDVLIMFVDTLFDADLSLVKRLPDDIDGVIWAKEVEDYQSFGVIVKNDAGNMKRIVEKPTDPVSKLANIGLYYIRDWKLLFEGIRSVMEGPMGKTGEYYLTDAFQYMIDHGAKIRVEEVVGWYDCGQAETLLETNRHVLENAGRGRRPTGGHNVRIVEPVRVEEGAIVDDSEIGPNVTIEADAVVRGSKLRDTIIGQHTTVKNSTLHDSIVGAYASVQGVSGKVSLSDHSAVTADGKTPA
jgi:glucose-1-phosphate thymidylyltransferase